MPVVRGIDAESRLTDATGTKATPFGNTEVSKRCRNPAMPFDISGSEPIEVVGESFYRPALQELSRRAGGSQTASLRASLVCDPANPYDQNAVKVMIGGLHVGHLPRELAALVAERIADLTRENGEVECAAEIRGSDPEFGQGVVLWVDVGQLGLVLAEQEEDSVVELEAIASVPAASVAPSDQQLSDSPAASIANGHRRQTVERAVERWKSELIDLTARNRLLYLRDLRTGTLSFDSSARDALMQLVAGKRVALSKLVPRSKLPENSDSKLTPFEDAVRRMRSIVRTARSYEEERGVRTLFLACGVATWRSDRASRPPAAPVLLVPLSIKARGASQQDFDLSLAGDLEVNPTLLHLLKVEFNLEIDDQELYEHADMDGVIDTPEELRLTYNWLSERCATVPDWAIADRFVLGNFWYAKLPMVKDLETSIDSLSSHEVAAALAGDKEAQQALAAARQGLAAESPPSVDGAVPANEFNVLDSDSSQSLAIARACAGESMVLKGPPGTGKSQTIANLICHAIGESKRVLFVAEKRAAIEAVTKRLNAAGLGDLVLDLHQGAESRKWLAGQLDISLNAVRTAGNVAWDAEEGRLVRARHALGEHAAGLHLRHGPWDVSVLDAQLELIARGRPSLSTRLRGPDLESVGREKLTELTDSLRDLLAVDGLSLRAKGSPWRDANVDSAELAREAVSLVEATSDLIVTFRRSLSEVAIASGLPESSNLGAAQATVEAWEALRARQEVFNLEIFEDDLDALLTNLEPLQGSAFSRFLAALTSADFRTGRDVVLARVREGRTLEPPQLYAELAACRQLREQWIQLGGSRVIPVAADDLGHLRTSLDRLGTNCQRLGELVGRDLVSIGFDELEAELASLKSSLDTAMVLPSIQAGRRLFVSAALDGFLAELEDEQALLPEAQEELERVWWQSLADHLMMLPESEELTAFRGERHDQVLETFRELDRQHVLATAQRVKRIAAETAIRAQDQHPDQAQLVREQAKRKRRHMPVRELFARAPDVLTALRPCWVMSPLMVSQLIPSEQAYFDLVVFDEASQVRPVEALTSMIRGTQLVVAGDNHQLPPTAFFDAAAVDDGDSSAEKDEEESTEIGDYESLLDVLMTLFDTEMLRWHYRSRDERLIGFSNQEIYDSGLTTFPGVVDGDVLSHVLVDELPGPEEARVSPDAEVRRVAELVLEHAQTRPEESLGVIALGIKHAEAIEAGLLAALPNYPELESFFDEAKEERFFVKNLERVQGDERDAIILAIGYGKQSDGTLPHRFGPLNNAGGERRLNVAVTRAKQRMTVVSSFRADDVDPKRSSAEGVRLLRAFLAYASRGGDVEQAVDAGSEANALHRLISESMRRAGYETAELVGTSADRIDVAVVDPERGVPRVAIEVDGPSYARRPSVRDRDRLRPEQLKRLGWRYIATWSQDWYRDPAVTAQRLAERVAAELEGRDGGADGEALLSPETPPESPTPTQGRGPRPALFSGGPAITDWRLNDLVELARWIESDGLLRTAEELERELMEELGITRRGSRVARVLEEVVARLRTPPQ